MKIEDGKLYYNRRGDLRGPMLKHDIGFFVDQHGSIYHPDGKQWDHHPDSSANLVETVEERAARKIGACNSTCVCGHTLGIHCAGGFDCFAGQDGFKSNPESAGLVKPCECQKFRPSRKKRP